MNHRPLGDDGLIPTPSRSARHWRKLVGCLCLVWLPGAAAFSPPLTGLDAQVETNGLDVKVVLQIFDPALGRSVVTRRKYDGSPTGFWSVPELVVQEGVAAWRAEQQGVGSSRDTEVAYGLYDPARSSWRVAWSRFEGSTLGFWTPSSLQVSEGTVVWKVDRTDTVSSRDSEVHFARYDARQGIWVRKDRSYRGTTINHWVTSGLDLTGGHVVWHALNTGSIPTWEREIVLARFDPTAGSWILGTRQFKGTSLNFWTVTRLLVSDRMAAWSIETQGSASLLDIEVGHAVYDPVLRAWNTGRERYDGQINDPWVVTNLTVSNHDVQWETVHRDRIRVRTRGYDAFTGAWDAAPTVAFASFAVSTNSGPAPLGVWFEDQSLGASSWLWNFGDGSFSTDPCPYHVYDQAGTFPVTLTVAGPGGTETFAQVITAAGLPGEVRFVPGSARFSNGTFRVIVSGLTPLNSLVVERSTNLAEWEGLLTNPPGPVEFEVLDDVGTGPGPRFYRALQP